MPSFRSAAVTSHRMLLCALVLASGCSDETSSATASESDAAVVGARDGAVPASNPSVFTDGGASATSTSPIEAGPAPALTSSAPSSAAPSSNEAGVDTGADSVSLEDIECEHGILACSHGNAYQCEGSAFAPEWKLRADVSCPLWSASACEAAVAALRAESQPCNVDADCAVWGGIDSEDACNGTYGAPIISVSSFTGKARRQQWYEDFEALVAGGCQEQVAADSAPPEPVCYQGGCYATDRSCFDHWTDERDASPDADASREASASGELDAGSSGSTGGSAVDSSGSAVDAGRESSSSSSSTDSSQHGHGH